MKLALVLTCAFALLAASARAADEPLIGLWAAEISLPSGPGGTLTVTRNGENWTGEIAGALAKARNASGELQLAFPNGDSFRGKLVGNAISGFWVQHRDAASDPAGFYATLGVAAHVATGGTECLAGNGRAVPEPLHALSENLPRCRWGIARGLPQSRVQLARRRFALQDRTRRRGVALFRAALSLAPARSSMWRRCFRRPNG